MHGIENTRKTAAPGELCPPTVDQAFGKLPSCMRRRRSDRALEIRKYYRTAAEVPLSVWIEESGTSDCRKGETVTIYKGRGLSDRKVSTNRTAPPHD
ncbi:hypothetical protein LSAT2_023156 [Lamellibrachia satsuma]|nr:hypothetical protein LSAT2_023156 [Lamellibrachia satsuma]